MLGIIWLLVFEVFLKLLMNCKTLTDLSPKKLFIHQVIFFNIKDYLQTSMFIFRNRIKIRTRLSKS